MKTWKPDTCDCKMEEIYEGHTITGMGQVLRKCEVHQSVPDAELYGVIISNSDSEQTRKSDLLRILLGYEDIKDLGLEKVTKNQEGDDVVEFADGVEYVWSFEGLGKDRKLIVDIKGKTLTKGQKDSIKALSDQKFGLGKVEII